MHSFHYAVRRVRYKKNDILDTRVFPDDVMKFDCTLTDGTQSLLRFRLRALSIDERVRPDVVSLVRPTGAYLYCFISFAPVCSCM